MGLFSKKDKSRLSRHKQRKDIRRILSREPYRGSREEHEHKGKGK